MSASPNMRCRSNGSIPLIGDFARPALCKIDVQGAELMVLEGMSARMVEIDAIVIETSALATIEHGPEVFDVMAKLKELRLRALRRARPQPAPARSRRLLSSTSPSSTRTRRCGRIAGGEP